MGMSKYAIDYDLGTVQGRLYYARMAHRLTRTVVAKAFGTTKGALKNWERGDNETRTVPYEYIKFAALAYAVPESWLLGETHETPLPPPSRPTTVEAFMECVEESPQTRMRRRLKGRWDEWHWPLKAEPRGH